MPTPKPSTSTGYVAADFSGRLPRFLCQDSRRQHWVIVTEPLKAKQFVEPELARLAIAEYLTPTRLNYTIEGNADWRVWQVAVRVSFAPIG